MNKKKLERALSKLNTMDILNMLEAEVHILRQSITNLEFLLEQV